MADYMPLVDILSPRHECVIVKCSQRNPCLRSNEISREIETLGVMISNFEVHPRENTFGIKLLSAIRDKRLVVVFHCHHVKSTLENIIKQHLIPHSDKVVIITETHYTLRHMETFTQFTIKDTDAMIQHIQEILKPCEEENSECSHEYTPQPPERRPITHETDLKELIPPTTNIKPDTVQPSGFIHAETLDADNNENRGIYVLRSGCFPKVQVLLSVNEMKRRFNGATEENREDLSKQILAITLKDVIKKGDFLNMLNLLDIGDWRIQCSVLSAINAFQLETNLYSRCIKGTEILRAAKCLFGLCQKWSANPVTMIKLLPVTLDTIAILYLSSCISGMSQSNLVPETQVFADNSVSIVEKMISNSAASVESLSECSDLLCSLKTIFENLKNVGKNPSPLLMGNFRDCLMNEESRIQLKKKFRNTMTYLEQYSFIQIVMNQIVMKSDLQIVVFLGELTEIMVGKVAKKPKCIQTIYALLRVITKGITHRLCKARGWIAFTKLRGQVCFYETVDADLLTLATTILEYQYCLQYWYKKYCEVFQNFCIVMDVYLRMRVITTGSSLPRTTSEYQLTLCKVLNIFLDTAPISQMVRLHLLCLIEPLLFKETKKLVTNAVYLFQRNNQQSKDIRGKVSKHILQQLAVINFKLDGIIHQSSNVGLEPSWVTFAGTVSEDKHVVMHGLIPTLHCIVEGSMEDYKRRANKNETRKHLNTLDILKHLQDEKLHHNLIQLIAFQCRPLPMFYITDKSMDYNLNSHLLDARQHFTWISYRELITMVADAVDAVSFLHSKQVVHRNLTTCAFSLRNKTIVLHDLSVAEIIDNSTRFISDLDSSEIPVLWSAPESILEDHYDSKTDIWMLGQFIYEVFTHGCHPYTEVYRTPTEHLLEYIVFQDLKPYKWPCIPKEVHDIIFSCVVTKPEDRLDISRIRKLLSNILISFQGEKKRRVTQIFDEDKKYPELDINQTLPERGLPNLFLQLKKNNTQDRNIIRKSYFNTKQRRLSQQVLITIADTKAPDQPIIQQKFRFLVAYEPVTIDFIHSLPHLDKETCTGVLQMLDSPSREERKNIPGDYQYLLKFRLKESTQLFDLAFRHSYGDPEDDADSYLHIVLKIVKFVGEMHKRNWILRDLCADNIYVTVDNEVTAPRLGRMLWFDPNNVLDDCIIDSVKQDRQRWLPLEVLQNGQYSKEGDVYMVAMVIYEFYMALEIHATDPMASQLECAPFAKVSKEELLKSLYSGEVQLQPIYCPDWLYDILKDCWNRDRTRRPSIQSIIKQFTERLRSMNYETETDPEEDYDDPETYNDLENHNDLEDYEDLEQYVIRDDTVYKEIEKTVECPTNSDTDSDISCSRHQRSSNSSDSFYGSAYYKPGFICVNSMSSGSDNRDHYTDAQSKQTGNAVRMNNRRYQNTERLEDDNYYNWSPASSSYCSLNNKQNEHEHRDLENNETHTLTSTSENEITGTNIHVGAPLTDGSSDKSQKQPNNAKHRSWPHHDITKMTIANKETEPMNDDDNSSGNISQTSSTYFITLPHAQSSSLDHDEQLPSRRVLQLSSNRMSQIVQDAPIRPTHSPDSHEGIEHYQDFESTSNDSLFSPPSTENDDYLTCVYDV